MNDPVLYGEDGNTPLPWKWAICIHCQGHGKSSAYLGAFTRSDLDEMGHEWCEDYFAGRLDRACDRCEGLGRVKVADWAKLTPAQRKALKEQRRGDREYDAMVRAERAAGC